jgi:HlyD family secretion protein
MDRTSADGKVVSSAHRTSLVLWSGFWRNLRGRFWQISFGFLIVAAIMAFVYERFLAPVDVLSHEVKSGEIVAEVMGTGTVEAHVKVTISSKISGRLTEILVDQGDQVKAGKVLARLDDHDLKHQVEVEEATVGARKAMVERLIADRNSAKSTLELATKNYERAQPLFAQRAISLEEYDRSSDAFATGKAGMDRAEAALVEGKKLLIAAEKTLEFQQARLEDTVITAPFDGLIVRRDRDPGDVVVPGTSVLLLVSLKEIWISAWVDETRMAVLKPGQLARVVFRSEPAVIYTGAVVRLGRETDRETREFLAEVQPAKLPEQWSIGQRAEVYIETAHKSQATLLPSKFLVKRGGKAGVFVAVQGRVQWRALQLGLQGRETVEIIEGLMPGEIVVMPSDSRARQLAHRQRVKLQ